MNSPNSHPTPALVVDDPWELFAAYLASCRYILCLAGAGLSAPSGLRTWRAAGGFWNNINIKEIASPYTFAKDPVLVWTFYGERMLEALTAKPNAAHHALAKFAEQHGGVLTINQNIDGLLEDTNHPISSLRSVHGTLRSVRCTNCEYSIVVTSPQDLPFLHRMHNGSDHEQPINPASLPHCPQCSALLRPNIVWFGERLSAGGPDAVDEWIDSRAVDLVLAVGTSLRVFPAAEFVYKVRSHGARLAVINNDIEDGPIDGLERDDWFFEGDVATILPMILRTPALLEV